MKTSFSFVQLVAWCCAAAAFCIPAPVRAELAILDPRGNLSGDPTRAFMDILETRLRTATTNFIFEFQVAAPFPAAVDMTGGKRFDLIWFIDIDRNRTTGQNADGNDYNIHVYLDENGWHYLWLKVSSFSQADGITVLDSTFRIAVSGDRATLMFPKAYLPSRSFDMWAFSTSGNAPKWTPVTQNLFTARATFDLGFNFEQTWVTVDESVGAAVLTVLRQDDSPEWATVDYATADGTAKAGLDYTAVAGTLVFPPGERSATIGVPILDDGLGEGTEQLTLRLSNPSANAALGQMSSTLLTITDNEPSDFSYTTEGPARTISGYHGPGGAVTIPDSINGLSVTRIGDGAFYHCASVTSVAIPGSVTSIGATAFGGCANLTSVNIGNSVTSIGGAAFAGCSSLTNVTIPNSVSSLGGYAFDGCRSLISVMIPERVTSIGDRTFRGCIGLISVTIPDSVTDIWYGAFEGCAALTNITIPNSVTNIWAGAFAGCTGLTSIMIPDSVTKIADGAFGGCTSLTAITVDPLNTVYRSVDGVLMDKSQRTLRQCPGGKAGIYTVPDCVTSIGSCAFAGCAALTNITIPNSVTNIGEWMFSGCAALNSVTMPSSVTSIGESTFQDCTILTSVTIPNSVTDIRMFAFSGCTSLTSVTIPNSVTNIARAAFSGCTSLASVTIPDSVTDIWASTFSGCTRLTSVTIPDSVTDIGWSAFSGCTSLTRVTIPNSVTSIGIEAFRGCTGLTSVTIPHSVTDIGWSAFSGCTSLTSVTVPDSVTNIGGGAFRNCTSLTGVYFEGNTPEISDEIFAWSSDEGDYIQDPAIVYHLPGTTGWDTTCGGCPTAVWLPQVQTGDASFGVQTNRFGFTIKWARDKAVIVEASTDLSNPNWSPVSTNTLAGGTSYFSDPQWAQHPRRFYRVRAQ